MVVVLLGQVSLNNNLVHVLLVLSDHFEDLVAHVNQILLIYHFPESLQDLCFG